MNLESQGLPPGIGWAELTRPSDIQMALRTTSFYLGDTLSLGRMTLNAGARFDRQEGENRPATLSANGLAPDIVPALEFQGADPTFTWNDVSPRVGATFRVTDRTIVKASYGRFAEQLRSNYVAFNNPLQLALIEYYFQDANGDNQPQRSELLEPTGYLYGIDPDNPAAAFSPNRVDPDLKAPITHSVVAGIEHQLIGDFTLAVNGGYGYITRTIWAPFQNLTRADYVQVGTAGEAAGTNSTTPIYALAPGASVPAGRGILLSNRDGYHLRSWNVDFMATKRLSNRWMFRGSLTLQNTQEFFDDPALALQDPTPRAVTTETPLFIPPTAAFDGGISRPPRAGAAGRAATCSSTPSGPTAPWRCTNCRGT